MKLFAKIVNGCKPLTITRKSPILDVWVGSEFTSGDSLTLKCPQHILVRAPKKLIWLRNISNKTLWLKIFELLFPWKMFFGIMDIADFCHTDPGFLVIIVHCNVLAVFILITECHYGNSKSSHSFVTYGKFSEKLTFLTPWYVNVHVCIRG